MVAAMSQNERWTTEDMPDLAGMIAVVTGANSGVGYAATHALAQKGAHVVMGCRNVAKAAVAAATIRATTPAASLEVLEVDLANLASVRRFAQAFVARHHALHLLLNNAGVMWTPHLTTVDGFELQFGTNHLGHFALTGLLLDRILRTEGARVVTMSSAAAGDTIDFEDLMGDRSYSRFGAYAQSKLANLLFACELHRRLRAAGSHVGSLAAHPGGARTNLAFTGPGMASGGGLGSRITAALTRIALLILIPFLLVVTHSAADGALPLLYAATSPHAESGAYYGPRGVRTKYPTRLAWSAAAQDEALARRLWEVSSDLTEVQFRL